MTPEPNQIKVELQREPADGDSLGLTLRILYNRAYSQGFYDCQAGEKLNTNHYKDDAVAIAYADVRQREVGDVA